jgi:hypothetical protein
MVKREKRGYKSLLGNCTAWIKREEIKKKLQLGAGGLYQLGLNSF